MIISEINLSYPCVKYTIDISHFTSRKSTAIEWLILETINKVSSMKQYEGVAVDTVFKEIFTISDSDLLIKPCLLSLQDLGAITLVEINNATELKNIPMRNLQMTQVGKKMQKEGLLPGTTSKDKLSIYFDVKNNFLLEKVGNNYKLEATGTPIYNINNADEVDFPANLVRELLDKKRNRTTKGKPSWLMPTTTINDITASKSELYWKNIIKKMHITKGLRCFLDGNEDEEINTLALQNCDFEVGNTIDNFPVVDIYDPDTELERIVPLSKVKDVILNLIKNDSLYLIDYKYYKDLKIDENNTKSKLNTIVVYNSDEFLVGNNRNQLIVKIPDKILPEEIVYQNKSSNISIGKFNLNTPDYVRAVPFAYIPKQKTEELANSLISIVEKYYKENNIVIFLLNEIGLKDLYLKYVKYIISDKKGLKDKADTIEEINKLSIQFYNQKSIRQNTIEELLLDSTYISSKSIDIDGIVNIIKECSSTELFKRNDKLFQSVLKIALPSIKHVKGVEEVWMLWKEIYSIKKSYVQWISKENLYKTLYSEKVVTQILSLISSEDLYKIKEYTVVEQTILHMRRILDQIQNKLPQIHFDQNFSDEIIMENIMLHKEELPEIYDAIKQWNDAIDVFNLRINDYDTLVIENDYLSKATVLIGKIADALKVFFNEETLKYKKVFIADTCILMHEPGLISWFSEGKSMLIIPQIVLNELDKLKESTSESEAFSARDVIRQISNYKSYDWLNIKEESHVELLPKDLDNEKNDNKILSIGIKYIIKKPILLTDDINLRNIASSKNITSLDLNELKNMMESQTLNNQNKQKKKKRKKKNE